MRGMGTRHLVVGLLGLSVAVAFFFPLEATAKSKWMVESKHLRSYERAKDCSVFKSVAWHALEEQRQRESNAKKIENLVKERRAALEKCGVERGLPSSALSGDTMTDDQDRVLAEMCPGPYADWLAPGYRAYSIRHEMREYEDALETIKVVLRFRCGEKDIREVKWDLPTEPETATDTAPTAYLNQAADNEALPGATVPGTATAKLLTPDAATSEYEQAVE